MVNTPQKLPECLTIATRKSPLAYWQANFVKNKIKELYPQIEIAFNLITTTGDINLAGSLATLGGKGLFIKELEVALLEKKADIAVHSMKDMTVTLPENLFLAAFLPRGEVRDAFVSRQYDCLEMLPKGAIVGTSSLRRKSQLLSVRPDLNIQVLRGNVNTRLEKLNRGEYDAIILAAAGLLRLDLEKEIKQLLPLELMLPAIGQAIIGIESRSDDEDVIALIRALNCAQTEACIVAERTMNQLLGGNCAAPIAGLATIENEQLHLHGRVLSPDGKTLIEATGIDQIAHASQLGAEVAKKLFQKGAKKILDSA